MKTLVLSRQYVCLERTSEAKVGILFIGLLNPHIKKM